MIKIKRKNRISFDIGSKNIKITSGYKKGEQLYINNFIVESVPRGFVSDSKILDPQGVAQLIKKFLNEYDINVRNALISLSSSRAIQRIINIPKLKEKELKEVVKYELNYLLSDYDDNYIVDYTVIEEYSSSETDNRLDMMKVQAVAVPGDLINSYLKTLKLLGLNPAAIDIQPNCIVRVVNFIHDDGKRDSNYVIIDLGYEKTTITTVEHGNVQLYRVINRGVKSAILLAQKYLGTDEKSAENYIMSADLTRLEAEGALQSALNAYLRDLMAEIIQVIEYFKSKTIGSISQVYLIGGGALLNNIDVLFRKYINEPLSIENHLNKISTPPSADLNRSIFLWNSIGMMLRED